MKMNKNNIEIFDQNIFSESTLIEYYKSKKMKEMGDFDNPWKWKPLYYMIIIALLMWGKGILVISSYAMSQMDKLLYSALFCIFLSLIIMAIARYVFVPIRSRWKEQLINSNVKTYTEIIKENEKIYRSQCVQYYKHEQSLWEARYGHYINSLKNVNDSFILRALKKIDAKYYSAFDMFRLDTKDEELNKLYILIANLRRECKETKNKINHALFKYDQFKADILKLSGSTDLADLKDKIDALNQIRSDIPIEQTTILADEFIRKYFRNLDVLDDQKILGENKYFFCSEAFAINSIAQEIRGRKERNDE
jgi:hypothetical protein